MASRPTRRLGRRSALVGSARRQRLACAGADPGSLARASAWPTRLEPEPMGGADVAKLARPRTEWHCAPAGRDGLGGSACGLIATAKSRLHSDRRPLAIGCP